MKPEPLATYLQNNLLRMDIEFGNSKGFFSASKDRKNQVREKSFENQADYTAEIPDATILVQETQSLSELEIERTLRFTPTADTRLFDLVSRFVVLSNNRSAHIAGLEIPHSSSNIYYQHETNEALVPIGENAYLKLSDQGSFGHPLFDKVFYIRDEAIEHDGMKRWIVHHRLIVKPDAAELIVRCCHPKFEGPLPAQWLIPKFLKERLFRIREQRHPNFPIMAVGEIFIPCDFPTEIRTRVQLLHD